MGKPILFQCHNPITKALLFSASIFAEGLLHFTKFLAFPPSPISFMWIFFFFSRSLLSTFALVLQMQIFGNDNWHLKVYLLWLFNMHWTLGKNKQIILYFSCLHQFEQSTDKKVIYICVWQDKGFLFLKHGRDGKTFCFLHFMNYVLVMCHLPLPPHHCAKSKELNLGPSKPK